MATIKSYSDLQQSRKLAEILPLESADMRYICIDICKGLKYMPEPQFIKNIPDHADEYDIRCWSLAALLDVIPKHIKDYNVLRIDVDENNTAIWYDEIGWGVNNDLPNFTKKSAVDACYEMIIHLHELKML